MNTFYLYKLKIGETKYYFMGYSDDNVDNKNKRINKYKNDYKYSKAKSYIKMRELIDNPHKIILVKILTGLSKEQAIIGEGSLINLDDPFCLNSKIGNALGNGKTNMGSVKGYNDAYYQNNKEEYLKDRKIYRDNNKDKINAKCVCGNCGLLVYARGLKRHKTGKYCTDYNVNKGTWIKCECGLLVKTRLTRHKQSKKHNNQMQLLSQ